MLLGLLCCYAFDVFALRLLATALSRCAPSATVSKSLRLRKLSCAACGGFGQFASLRVLVTCSRALRASGLAAAVVTAAAVVAKADAVSVSAE